MKHFLAALVILVSLSACNTQKPASEAGPDASDTKQAPAVEKKERDISNETLVALDPDIQAYVDKVENTKAANDASGNAASKEALVKAYIEFGDYMQYSSPISPRQGKYHRALVEYRHALEIDPGNKKADGERMQIENIYSSMGRPIPGS